MAGSRRLGSLRDIPCRMPAHSNKSKQASRSQRSCTALLLNLMFPAGLAGCGLPISDKSPSLDSHSSVDRLPLSKQGPSLGNNSATPVTPTMNSIPLALGNETGAASGRETVPGGDRPHAMPVPSSEQEHPVEGLVVPELMAQKLNSPNVRVRLRVLDTWANEASPGAVDPFVRAFEDKDERVPARAQQLIEQGMARNRVTSDK
jgi:hypothetical protein